MVRRSHTPLLLCLTLVAACGGGADEGGPQVTSALPSKVFNHRDVDLVLRGKNLRLLQPDKARAGKLRPRALLWAGTKERLQRAVSLDNLRADSDSSLTARLPAGTHPGTYQLVLTTGSSSTFTGAMVTVVEFENDVGLAQVLRVKGALYSDVPGRLYFTGSNLRTTRGVALRRQGGVAVPLTRVRKYNAARIGATLAAGRLQPGTYRLRVANRHGWVDGPAVKVRHSGFADEARLSFGVYFGVLGLVFVVGLLLAAGQGELRLREARGRRNLVLLLSGFVFTLVTLGSVQFFLSWWS